MSLTPGSTETSAVVIPPYISVDPSLWFCMLESTFQIATPKAIIESKTKYNYVVAHLPPTIASMVRDVIMKPDTTDPYDDLKKKILERCEESRTLEIRKLLSGESLGDRKPTELLRIMKRRADGHNVNDELLLELFCQQMPTSVQTILALIVPITPEKAAEIADRILDLTPSNVNSVSVLASTPQTAAASSDNRTPPATEMLLEAIKDLRTEISELRRSISISRNNTNQVLLVFEAVPSTEEIALAKKYQLPETFYLYKNKPDCPGCIGCEDYVAPPKSSSNETTVTDTTTDTTSSSKTEQESPAFMFSTNAPSFADLASNTVSSFSSSNQKKGFAGAGTPLFANLNTSADGDKDDDTVAEGPDIHFEPVIPLPELIAVKTGEEDETPIFVNRAKLYRYDAVKKEWKERGVGDLKILQHKEKVSFRIILRRDQVHKIACNHCIDENMELSPLTTSETALCWNAVDYSDNEPEASQFAVRFKTKDLLAQFKQKFNECRDILKKESKVSKVLNSSQVCEETNASNLETSSKDNPAETQNEQGSESETNEEDEDSDDDSVDFEKRVTFEISEGNDEHFQSCGTGTLKVIYDDSVYGYRICMISDNGACLCDHIIAIQTVLRTEKKKASWTAIDLSVEPPRHRRFRATFSSMDALNEFNTIFEDAKDAALQSEIVEKSEYQGFLPPGKQT